jgi:hypothetical protein
MPFISSIASTIENNIAPIIPANNIPIIASGGTITTGTDSIGDYKIHTFNSSETFQLTQAYEGAVFQALLVGAGGSGSPNSQGYHPVYNIQEQIVPFLGNSVYYVPGSGGAGGSVIYISNLQLSVGNSSVVVGNTTNYGDSSFSGFVAGGKGRGCSLPEKATLDSTKEHNLYYEAHDGCPGAMSFIGNSQLSPLYRWNAWPYDQCFGWDKNYYGVTYDISGQNVAYGVPGPTGYREGTGAYNDPKFNNTLQASTTPGSGSKGNTGNLGQNGITIIKYYVNNPKNRIFLNGGRVTANTNYTCHEFRNVTNWPLLFSRLPKDQKIDILVSSPGNLEPYDNGSSGNIRIFYDQKVEFGDVYYIDAKPLADLKPGAITNLIFTQLFAGGSSSILRIKRGQAYTMGFGATFDLAPGGFLKVTDPGSGYSRGRDFIGEKYIYSYPYPPYTQTMVTGGEAIIDTQGNDSASVLYKTAAEVRVRKYSTYFKNKPLTEWSLKSSVGLINQGGILSGTAAKSNSSNTLINYFGYGTDCYDNDVLTLSDYGNYVNYDPTGNVFTIIPGTSTVAFTANSKGMYLNFTGANVRYSAAATSNAVFRSPAYSTMQDQYVPPDPARVIIRYKSWVPAIEPTVDSNVAPQTASTGSVTFTNPGTGYWTCPQGVYSVNVLCIGGGGAGGVNFERCMATGGGGAGVAWKNNIPVTPGKKYMYKVGLGGKADAGESNYIDNLNPYGGPAVINAQAWWPGGAGGGGEKSFFADDWLICGSGGGGGTGGDRMIKSWFWNQPDYVSNWQNPRAIKKRQTGKDGEGNTFAYYTKKDTKTSNTIYFIPPRDANYPAEVNTLSETIVTSLPVNPVVGRGYLKNTNDLWVYNNNKWNNLGKTSLSKYNWLNQYNSNSKNILISVGGKGDSPDEPAVVTGSARTTSQGGGWAGQGGGKGKSSNTIGMFATQKVTNVPYDFQIYYGYTQPEGWDAQTKTLTSTPFYTAIGGAGAGGYDDSITSGGGGNAGRGVVTLGYPRGTNSQGQTTYQFLQTVSATPGFGGGGVGILGKGLTSTDSLTANTVGRGGSNGQNGGVVTTQNYDWRSYQPRSTVVPGKGGTYGAGSGGGNAEGVDGFLEVVMPIPGYYILTEPNMGRGSPAANGVVKIIWGSNKFWPNSNTATT